MIESRYNNGFLKGRIKRQIFYMGTMRFSKLVLPKI